ncbi:MAG: polysaccharide deacetylase family protein [Pygmaiobacter massiliensis]|nr:polysaccharide deacetylase family protein [Pygmaiobacter massiliensis]
MRRFFCISVRARAICCLLMTGLLLHMSAMLPASAAAGANGVALPIIMYHSVLKDKSLAGPYIVTPETIESDFAYIKAHEYTTMFVSELANAVLTGEALPEKPIIITFDDGYLNNLTYVLPLLEKYDMKAVISVVGSYCECYAQKPDPNPAYAYLCWEDIDVLTNTGRIEIGNHSYNLHRKNTRKGAKKKLGESDADYYAALLTDVGKTQSLLEEYCGIVPTTFAYPFGYISKDAVPILQEMGFTAMLTCCEKVNIITGEPKVLQALGRFNRPYGVSTQRFMARIGVE